MTEDVKRLLVVDDEPDFFDYVKRKAKRLGYEVFYSLRSQPVQRRLCRIQTGCDCAGYGDAGYRGHWIVAMVGGTELHGPDPGRCRL